jgi:hypothetical protein
MYCDIPFSSLKITIAIASGWLFNESMQLRWLMNVEQLVWMKIGWGNRRTWRKPAPPPLCPPQIPRVLAWARTRSYDSNSCLWLENFWRWRQAFPGNYLVSAEDVVWWIHETRDVGRHVTRIAVATFRTAWIQRLYRNATDLLIQQAMHCLNVYRIQCGSVQGVAGNDIKGFAYSLKWI